MKTTAESSQLFNWLTDDQLQRLVVKLQQLPTGSEFERRVEEDMATTVGIEARTYAEIIDDHGDLIGYTDPDEGLLPWWLEDFEWTVTSDPLDPLSIDKSTLDQFRNFPLDTTRVDGIALDNAESVINGLDAFSRIEEQLTTALGMRPAEIESTDDVDPDDYTLPKKLFVDPERGRIDTSNSFEDWFEHVVNLCPPGCPELTALLRVNPNVRRRHAEQVLTEDHLQRLTKLGVFESTDSEARAFNEDYHDAVSTLLRILPPFDLEFDVTNDKRSLTELQFAYYRAWASDTNRLSKEQHWLRMARNTDDIEESDEYRFAEYAFQLPIKLDRSKVVFEDLSPYGDDTESRLIASVLEEYGHPVNDD